MIAAGFGNTCDRCGKGKHLGLRIDSETHEKLKSLAEYEGRSINGEVLYLIRQAIARHEQEKGTLDLYRQ